ncbi:hypothetical protein ACU8MT_01345 [Rhizobium leguminosarum]
MKFRIANLKVHHALRDWMGRQYGESCAATTMLMLLTIVHVASRHVGDFELRHMQVVRKVKDIATKTGRPQRVPTYREFESLFDQYEHEFYCKPYMRGAKFISPHASRRIVDAIVTHEQAAAHARIDRRQAG